MAVMTPKLEKNTKNKIKNFCPRGETLHFEALTQSVFKGGIMKYISEMHKHFYYFLYKEKTKNKKQTKNPNYFINRK